MTEQNVEFYLGNTHFINATNTLIRGEHQTTLEHKPAHILRLLCEKANQLVSKDELFDEVWGNLIVTEQSLTRSVSILRKALTAIGETDIEIKAITRKGYILKGEVTLKNTDCPAPDFVLETTESEIEQEVTTDILPLTDGEPEREKSTFPQSSAFIFLFLILMVAIIAYSQIFNDDSPVVTNKIDIESSNMSLLKGDFHYLDFSPSGDKFLYLKRIEGTSSYHLVVDAAASQIVAPKVYDTLSVGGGAKWLDEKRILLGVIDSDGLCSIKEFDIETEQLDTWYECQFRQPLMTFDVISEKEILLVDGEQNQQNIYKYNRDSKKIETYNVELGRLHAWPWSLKVSPNKDFAIFTTTKDWQSTSFVKVDLAMQRVSELSKIDATVWDFDFLSDDAIVYFNSDSESIVVKDIHSLIERDLKKSADNIRYVAVNNDDILFIAKPDSSSVIIVLGSDYAVREEFEYSHLISRPKFSNDRLYFIDSEEKKNQVWVKSQGIKKLTNYKMEETINDYLVEGENLYVGTENGIDLWHKGVGQPLIAGLKIKSLLSKKDDSFLAIAGDVDKSNLVVVAESKVDVLVKDVVTASFDEKSDTVFYTKLDKQGIYRYWQGREYLVNTSIGGLFQRIILIAEGKVWIEDTDKDEIFALENEKWTIEKQEDERLHDIVSSWNGGYIKTVITEETSKVLKGKVNNIN